MSPEDKRRFDQLADDYAEAERDRLDLEECVRELAKRLAERDAVLARIEYVLGGSCTGDLAADVERLVTAAQGDDLRTELAEERATRDRMRVLLTETALALKGPPPANTWWSWHDLPTLAAQMRAEVQRLAADALAASGEAEDALERGVRMGLEAAARECNRIMRNHRAALGSDSDEEGGAADCRSAIRALAPAAIIATCEKCRKYGHTTPCISCAARAERQADVLPATCGECKHARRKMSLDYTVLCGLGDLSCAAAGGPPAECPLRAMPGRDSLDETDDHGEPT